MKKNFSTSVFYLTAVAVFLLLISPCRADVLFIHDFKGMEYLMGKQEADLQIGYTDQAMFIDKKIRHTGEMMTTLFGKPKEERETAHFLLDKDQIREMDYHKGEIIIFPFERLSDVGWIKRYKGPTRLQQKLSGNGIGFPRPYCRSKFFPKSKR